MSAWEALGWIGNACYFSRFLIQWLASERKGESVIPLAFWYLSMGGAALLLIYGIADRDPVILLGQSVGVFVYARNLMLIARTKKRQEAS